MFLTRIRKGQPVLTYTFAALPGRTFEGVISAGDPVVRIVGRALGVRRVAGDTMAADVVEPGLLGRVDIVTETREATSLSA